MVASPHDDTARRHREYWRNRDLQPVTRNLLLVELATDHDMGPSAAGTEHRWLPPDVSDRLDYVSKGSELALYILLVSLFDGLAARYTRDPLCTVVAPLYVPGGGRTAGRFVVLQDRIEPSDAIQHVIERARNTTVGAYANADCSPHDLFGRDVARSVLANNPLLFLEGLHDLKEIPPWSPLSFRFFRDHRGVGWEARYDGARMRADLIALFCDNLAQFASDASRDFQRSVGKVDLAATSLAPELEAFSKDPAEQQPAIFLYRVFNDQAKRTPEATALVFNGSRMTYGELNDAASRLAAGLVDLGVEPHHYVVLNLATGFDTVTAMIAVLRIGAAFVPISCDEPKERFYRLLDRCRPRLVIAQDARDFQNTPYTVVAFDEAMARFDAERATDVYSDPSSDSAAYVMFTSGSTGEPRGVVIPQKGIANAVMWKQRRYAFGPHHTVLNLFMPTFDGFILNLFAPLVSGSQVVLVDDDEIRQPERIGAIVSDQAVSHLVTSPIVYRAVLDAAPAHQLRSLNCVTLAGEAADPETVRRSQDIVPSALVSNEYGPTENSVVSKLDCRQLDDLVPLGVHPCGFEIQGDVDTTHE